jgi:hypothetical protein
VADLDVEQARAALATAQGELRGAEGAYSDARRALELLLGRYPAAEIEARGDFVPVPPPVRAGLPSSLIARRPDVAASEHQVVAAFRKQEAAKLALLPSFALTLDGGRLSDKLLSLLSLNPTLLHAVIGMDVPIYQGGALIARVKIATAEQANAVARYGGVVLQAFGEVENGLTNDELFAERLRYDQDAVGDRIEAVRLAKIRYTAGASDVLTVLILQTQQIKAQAEVIQLRNAQLANRINLHLALGGGFDAAPAASPGAAQMPSNDTGMNGRGADAAPSRAGSKRGSRSDDRSYACAERAQIVLLESPETPDHETLLEGGKQRLQHRWSEQTRRLPFRDGGFPNECRGSRLARDGHQDDVAEAKAGRSRHRRGCPRRCGRNPRRASW